jgi:hypothetical protein
MLRTRAIVFGVAAGLGYYLGAKYVNPRVRKWF